jgi:hypothetical protein
LPQLIDHVGNGSLIFLRKGLSGNSFFGRGVERIDKFDVFLDALDLDGHNREFSIKILVPGV